MNYGLAYRIGFHPWEDAEEQPSFADKFSALLDREERGRQPPYGPALVAEALVVMAAARIVPLGVALYVGGAAAIAALWPLAYEMWKHPEAAELARQPRPMPVT